MASIRESLDCSFTKEHIKRELILQGLLGSEEKLTGPAVIRQEARLVLWKLLDQASTAGQEGIPDRKQFYPVDLVTIVRLLGWECKLIDGLDQRARCNFAKKIIFLDSSVKSAEERNFSLAHEIGHVVLHPNDRRVVLHENFACGGGSLLREHREFSMLRGLGVTVEPRTASVETEADRFAVELLMPAKGVRNTFGEIFGQEVISAGSSSVSRFTKLGFNPPLHLLAAELATARPKQLKTLCEQFGVSRSAMARRLIELALIRS